MGSENQERGRRSVINGIFERGRAASNVSHSSLSSVGSDHSDNSAFSDQSTSGSFVDRPQSGPDSKQNFDFRQTQRSRSHSRGRNRSQGSLYDGIEDQRNFQGVSRSKSRPPGHVPSLSNLFSNLKPFSRESKESLDQNSDGDSVSPATNFHPRSPSHSSSSSVNPRNISHVPSIGDCDESLNERGRNSSRRVSNNTNERSQSPSFRRLKLPSLSTLSPSNYTQDLSAAGYFAGSARRVLSMRSRSSSRSKIDDFQLTDNPTQQRGFPIQPSLPQTGNNRRRRSSNVTLTSQTSTISEGFGSLPSPRAENSSVEALESESLRHMDVPRNFSNVGNYASNRNESNYETSMVMVPPEKAREKPYFMRVYRPDGTFGTIACPIDITSEHLLKLAARKFFISEVDDYHLVALRPESVAILNANSRPVQLIRNLLIHAGYHSIMDRLDDVCRDDTSFLCHIVMANINEPLRPPLLTQGVCNLILTDTDVVDAPSLACTDARNVETLDVSRSAFQGTSTDFPQLKHLRLCNMFLLDGTSSGLASRLSSLMTNLTKLDLSGSGISSIQSLDFTEAPNLKYLDLRGNQLMVLPPTLLHLPFLEELLCGTNSLAHFDIWNPSLSTIDLSYNKFSRILLKNEQAMQMVNLKSLQLCANSLDRLPESLHLLPHLKELDVRHNMILNPLEAMTPTLNRLVASYNNPRLMSHRDSSSKESNEQIQHGTRYLPHLKQLKLDGLHTLRLHETFNMAKITCLDMRNTHMPYVHESLFQNAPNLKVLNLSNNSLTRLPTSIRDLRFLEELFVSNNSLVDLPATLFQLQDLRILDAHANNLKLLPTNIVQAPKLRILNLSSNLVTFLPFEPSSSLIGNSLVQLSLCDNQLTEDCFGVILQLNTLCILDLSYNFITELPIGLFSQLPLLEELYLSGNRVSTLPHDDLVHATQLRVLRINGNKLHALPGELSKAVNLEVLDVAANQLRYNVANWPFDWNWRWNQKLRYLNLSSNRRLEIRKSLQYIDESTGTVDLANLCILPKLTMLGLMDVTLTTNLVPFQTENCRVRTFGSDLHNFKVGIAECLGFRPLADNDLVVERFRGKDDEFLVAIFDGQNEYPGSGNKISHLSQDTFAAILKREMQTKDTTTVDALRRAFLATHREIGNTALLSSEEIEHTSLGHRSPAACRLGPMDWSAGTGATVLYFQGHKLYVATVGGARVVLSRSNGTHTVLSKPLPPVSAELDRIRSSGGIVDPKKSYVNNMSAHPRLIGCYTVGTVFSAAPSIYEYEFEALNENDQIIIGSSAMWDVMRHETAADIVRSSSQDPMLAAMKLRDFTAAYGMRDRMMALVIGRPWNQAADDIGRQHSAGDLYEDDMIHYRKRRQSLPEDSTLARLGTEVSPPFGEVTMVFTDIKNSTYLWESYPSVMRAAIKTHNSLMRRSIRLMDGYEVKNEGDAFIISFHTPIKALIWCLTVQQHLLTAEWPPELLEVDGCSPVHDSNDNVIFRGLSVRMGIHCGRPVAEPDPVTKRMDYFGPMVNRASRISGIALGGQISVSSDFLNMLQRDLGAHKQVQEGVSLENAYNFTSATSAVALERSATVLDHTEYVVRELGELKLRGIENPEHIYNIYPVSLASRKAYYETHDTGERQSHAEINPVIISEPERRRSSSIIQGSPATLNNPTISNTERNIASGSSTFVSSLGVPPSASLTGIICSGGKSEFPSADSLFISPSNEEHRLGDIVGIRSRQNSQSNESPKSRALRVKRSLHTNPQLVSGTISPLDDNVRDPLETICQLQSITKRLESVCLSSSGNISLASIHKMFEDIEPPMNVDLNQVESAQLLLLTRIENAITRLHLQYRGWYS